MEIKNPYGFIYITTNMVNGRRYIGQKKFFKGWKCYLGSGKAFKEAVKKYGRCNFVRDIVAIAYNKEELDRLEIEFIKNHNASDNRDYYNICCGGSGVKISTKLRYNCRKVVCLNNKTVYSSCKEASEIFNINCSSISSCCSEKNLSGGKKDNIPLVWMYFEEYLKLSNDEIKNKINSALNAKKLNNNYNSKKVICTTTGKIFDSITEGSNYYNCLRSHVYDCCNHKRKHCGKLKDGTRLTWMYYDEFVVLKEVIV